MFPVMYVFPGIATLINRLKKKTMTIAIDGSLYRFHPRFHNLMVLKIRELVNPGHKVMLIGSPISYNTKMKTSYHVCSSIKNNRYDPLIEVSL